MIATEGQRGVGFFVIGEGTVDYSVHGERVGSGGPGNHFGEVALIDDGPRSATVTAVTDVTAYGLTSWEFRPLVEESAGIAWELLQVMAKRLRLAENASRSPELSSEVGKIRFGARRLAAERHQLRLRAQNGRGLPRKCPPKTTQGSPASAHRPTTAAGAFPSHVVASTVPSPVTTRS